MYSSDRISLEEFVVSSIPICQRGCALETMLNVSQTSRNGTIVIVDSQQFPLGIVTAHRLLSIIVKYQHNSRITTSVGSQKHSDDRAALMANTNLTPLIEPIKILSSRVTVAEFIRYASDIGDRQKINYVNYAIVDRQGKFLGMLDTQKLFEFLVPDGRAESQPLGSELSPHLPNLIARIPLPLMIQEGDNKILYKNHYWQQHLERVKAADATDYSSQIAQWWLWQQTSREERAQLESHSCSEPEGLPLSFTQSASSQKVPTDNSSSSEVRSSCWSIFATSQVQISYLNGWYYVRIPLSLAKGEKNLGSTGEQWLVLAVEAEIEGSLPNFAREVDWSRLKDEFIAYIGHELKSPLTGIVGLSNLLKAQKLGSLNQRQVRYAEIIHRSGKRLTSLVNDLLELTSLTNNQQDLLIEPVDLETLCRQTYRQILEELETVTEKDTQDIYTYPQLELSPVPDFKTVFADESSLARILSCLIKRAVTSQPERIGVTVNSWTGWIAIVVWNQIEVIAGSQQPPETLASESISTAQGNSDLSLLIARQLAKAHGGDISIVYQASGRNEFTLLLPQTAADRALESSKTTSNKKPLPILIIEHLSHRIARIAAEIENLGYSCLVARTGIEGLEQARQLKPSYILMNPASSVLGGRDLLTLLKSNPDTKNIPVFILTTANHKLEASKTFRQAQGVICEPFDRETLVRILPVKEYDPPTVPQNITILCVYPEPEVIDETRRGKNLDFSLKDWAERDWRTSLTNGDKSSQNASYRVIEAEGLEQADMLARIWQLDVVVLDSVRIREPLAYLRSFQQSSHLASLPTIVLDSQTSAAANQIKGLTVYPCLLPANNRSIEDLMQVIQIATRTKNSRSPS